MRKMKTMKTLRCKTSRYYTFHILLGDGMLTGFGLDTPGLNPDKVNILNSPWTLDLLFALTRPRI
jgi:hypothetical protein